MDKPNKIISFLGFGYYQETTYLHPDSHKNEKVKTPFFQEALVEFYQPETLYILLTNKVENEIPKHPKPDRTNDKTNWQRLQECLDNNKNVKKLEIKPIRDIPEKNTPEDIWCIFDKITSCLEEGDRVIFDITYGFRSAPVVALLAVSYLRVARDIKIEGLLYGAFEAKNQSGETPSFDLLPIISLLEWTTATDQFIKTGNGEALSSLLRDNKSKDVNREKLADNIRNISQGLRLLRPLDVIKQAAELPTNIEAATENISKEVPPFALLLERIKADYSNFGLSSSGLANPKDFKEDAKKSLINLLEMVKWYIDKEQIVQALSLAREWLPTLLCYHFEIDAFDKNNRDEMELLLNGGKSKDKSKESQYLAQWSHIPEKQSQVLRPLWQLMANLRNDVLHSGFRQNPKSAEDIIEGTKQVFEKLQEIAKLWGLQST